MTTGSSGHPDHAQVAFPPPVIPLLGIAVGFAARAAWPLTVFPAAVGPAAGSVTLVAAVALFLWAVATMLGARASLPPNLPTEALVIRGPYRFSRNPIYLAMVLLLVGFGFMANSAWFFALAAVAAWLLRWGVILREEAYLEHKFGTEYLAYTERVRRWI